MLTLERVRTDVAALPGLAKVGVVAMAVSGLADVLAHLEETGVTEAAGHAHVHTSFEASAHLGGFLSMVVILLGVVIDGVQRTRARHAAAPSEKGVTLDAVR
jgi:hypothetical protein